MITVVAGKKIQVNLLWLLARMCTYLLGSVGTWEKEIPSWGDPSVEGCPGLSSQSTSASRCGKEDVLPLTIWTRMAWVKPEHGFQLWVTKSLSCVVASIWKSEIYQKTSSCIPWKEVSISSWHRFWLYTHIDTGKDWPNEMWLESNQGLGSLA